MFRKYINSRLFFLLFTFYFILFSSCSTQKQIHQSAKTDVLAAKALQTAHVGISIFNPSANKYLYNYQGDKYFVPASNTKIPTCYAAMKYLGDSLVGLRYESTDDYVQIYPTGDPTLYHADFPTQRILTFLEGVKPKHLFYGDVGWQSKRFGSGWSWNDFNESYMAERSSLPVYGNVFTISYDDHDSLVITPNFKDVLSQPNMFYVDDSGYITPTSRLKKDLTDKIRIERDEDNNSFNILRSNSIFTKQKIPIYRTRSFNVAYLMEKFTGPGGWGSVETGPYSLNKQKSLRRIHSQPTDSVLKPMMHRSDNFFAEQSLLMVSNEMLGIMNDAKIIDTLLKTDFKDLPQKPRWVDGSGLSRYNLFTPQDFVAILNKMKNEFGMERIKEIFPTGGEGTISSYYQNEKGFIYGKTGTLSGVVAFSGYLYTKKGKLLIFSTLVNNHNDSATEVRRAIEKFLQGVRNKY